MQLLNIGDTPALRFKPLKGVRGASSVDTRAAARTRLVALIGCVLAILLMLLGLAVSITNSVSPNGDPDLTPLSAVAAGGILLLIQASVLGRTSEAKPIRAAVLAGERRETHITPDDFSWRIVMNDNDEPRYDEARTVEFLAIPKVMGCDRILRSLASAEQPDPPVDRTAKQIILRHAQEIFDSEEDRRRLTLMQGDVWQEYAAAEDK